MRKLILGLLLALSFIAPVYVAMADYNGPGTGGSSITWPSSGDVVLSNSTNSPAGVAEVDGDCVVGVSGSWTASSCSGSASTAFNALTSGTNTTATMFVSAGASLTALDSNFTIKDSSDVTKLFVVSLGGETTGKTATVAFANALSATYTFPAATDTIVGRASTDTLTNKSIAGSEINSGTIPNAQIPAPTVSALGGIEAASGATSNSYVTYVDTSGVQHVTQPSCSTLSNSGTSCTVNTGTSGGTIPLLNGANTWSALQTHTGGAYYSSGYVEEGVYSNGNSGTSLAVNLDNGPTQSVTITGAVTITQTTPTHPGKYSLIVTQDGTGHVYSLSGIKWAGGTAPTYSTTASAIDIMSIIYDGTNYYGMGGVGFR